MKPILSIIIPAYNEEQRLPDSLRQLDSFFNGRNDVEIIVVVEKSEDDTLSLSREFAKNNSKFKIVGNDVRRGKGFAVKTGMLLAKGNFVFFMDADLSTSLKEIDCFLEEFKNSNSDIVIGSRSEQASRIVKKQRWMRRSLGRIFNFFAKSFGIRKFNDTQCGFKAFRSEIVQPLFSRQTIDGFSFDVEILLLAQACNFVISSKGVTWANSPDSKVHIVFDSLKMLVDLLKVRYRVRQTLRRNPMVRISEKNKFKIAS